MREHVPMLCHWTPAVRPQRTPERPGRPRGRILRALRSVVVIRQTASAA
jgi:hypothetical protein